MFYFAHTVALYIVYIQISLSFLLRDVLAVLAIQEPKVIRYDK